MNQGTVATWPGSTQTDGHPRRQPVGAEVVPGGVHFRVWAPNSKTVAVKLSKTLDFSNADNFELSPEEHGYFTGWVKDAASGMFYRYQLESGAFPDPASRFQPNGPHGPSQIVDPSKFKWTDQSWKGPPPSGLVIYELHIGTFTTEGTYAAAALHLPDLIELGVNVLEIMPVADFPGGFGWGYDGVNLFAPTRLYGSPDDLRSFVNQAHALGMSVILDVVYNHLGPDGNYLKQFSPDYFTTRHTNEWGDPLNFDGDNRQPVREFFTSNAAYWIDEFHFDGLRLDATQQIYDDSEEHILRVINRAARKAAGARRVYLVAENEAQHAELARPQDEGGTGLDALWNDDFHHSVRVALTGCRQAYFSDYNGTPQEFVSAAKHGYLFQGQWYSWQHQPRGTSSRGLRPNRFVHFIENHDQVANSLRGLRLWQRTSPGKLRAMTALLLLGPQTPMLFQGQEFAASSPFLFFADHHPELARRVAAGRNEFLRQFPSITSADSQTMLAEPGDEKIFLASKLNHSDREKHSAIYKMHCDLLRLRREDRVISNEESACVDGAVIGPDAFVLRYFDPDADDRLLLVNLGRDLRLSPVPEPLLAPPKNAVWRVKWSSESTAYGGGGTIPLRTDDLWTLMAESTLLLEPESAKTWRERCEKMKGRDGKTDSPH